MSLSMAAVSRCVVLFVDLEYDRYVPIVMAAAGYVIVYVVTGIRYDKVVIAPAHRTFEKVEDHEISSAKVYKNVLQVELFTRYLKHVSKKNFNLAVPYCVAEYNAALETFPGLFYFGYTNDALMSRVEIQKGIKLETSIDERYLMFCLDFEYAEQRVSDAHGGQMDMITFPEFAKNFRAAEKLHRTAVRVIHAFWKTLLSDKPDLNILPALIAKMQRIESQADALFVKLLTQGSKSQSVLREYAQYLRDVKLNTEEARRFDARADSIERGEYDGKGQHHGNSSSGLSTSDIKNNLDDSDLSTQGKIRKSMTRGVNNARNDTSLSSLRTYSVVGFLCVYLLMTGTVLVAWSSISDMSNGSKQAEAAGRRLELTTYNALLVREISAIGTSDALANSNIPGLNDAGLKLALGQNLEYLHDVHMSLMMGRDGVPRLTDAFNTRLNEVPNVIVFDFVPGMCVWTVVLTIGVLTFPWAMNHYINSLQVVSNANITVLHDIINNNMTAGDNVLKLKNKFNYVVENGHYSIHDGCADSIQGVVDDQAARQATYMYAAVGTIVSIIVFLSVIGLVVFKSALQEIQFDRNVALNLFLYIPKDTIMKLLDQNRKTLDVKKKTKKKSSRRIKIADNVPQVIESEDIEEMEEIEGSGSDNNQNNLAVATDITELASKAASLGVSSSGSITPAPRSPRGFGDLTPRAQSQTPRVFTFDGNATKRSGLGDSTPVADCATPIVKSVLISNESTTDLLSARRDKDTTFMADSAAQLTGVTTVNVSSEVVAKYSFLAKTFVTLSLLFLLLAAAAVLSSAITLGTTKTSLLETSVQLDAIEQFLKNSREMIIRSEYFCLTGDYAHVEAYYKLKNADFRRKAISDLRQSGMTESEMELFVQAKDIDDRLCAVEQPAMALAADAFGILGVLPTLAKVDWNEQDRNDYETEKLNYPKQTAWLRNKTVDTALPQNEKLQLARDVVLGYWHDKKQNNMIGLIEQMAHSIDERLASVFDDTKKYLSLFEMIGMFAGAAIMCTGIPAAYMLMRRRNLMLEYYHEQEETRSMHSNSSANDSIINSLSKMKPITIVVAVLLVMTGLCVIGIEVYVVGSDVEKFEESFDQFISVKSLSNMLYVDSMGTVSHVQSFANGCDLSFYRQYYDQNGPTMLLDYEEQYSLYVNRDVHERHVNIIKRLVHMEEVSLSLAANACNFESYLVPEIASKTWNYSTESDRMFENVTYVNRTLFYSDTVTDLALPAPVKSEMARLTVSDSRYWSTKLESRSAYAAYKGELMAHYSTAFENASTDGYSAAMMMTWLILCTFLLSFIAGAVLLTSLSKAEAPFSLKRLDLALVKQNVKLQQMKSLTNRFMYGYTGSIVLAFVFMTYVAIVIAARGSDIDNIRVSAELSTAASISNDEVKELYLQYLERSYSEFRQHQLDVTNKLPDVRDFQGDSVDDTALEALGYSVYALLQLGSDVDYSEHEFFVDLFASYHSARDHLLNILDTVYDDVTTALDDTLSSIFTFYFILLIAFLVVVYTTAIRSLKQIMIENERTSIMLMMIPQDVLVTVPEIRGYMQRHSEQKDRFIEFEQNQLELMRKDVQRLEEQNRIQSQLVNSMLPPHVAKQLAKGKTVKPERFESVTVLFADIVGFTTLCGQLDPIRVMAMLNKLFVRFDKLTTEHGLFKVETIGDAYMVVGGIPKQIPDHAQRCASMALDMIASIGDYQISLDNGEMVPLRIRCGMNSGSVVASVVGDIKCNPRYCLFGDTVNTASRMESTGVPMRIQVSPVSYELIKNDFVCEERGQVEIKGKGSMTTWFVVGPKTTASISKLPNVREQEATSIPGQVEVSNV